MDKFPTSDLCLQSRKNSKYLRRVIYVIKKQDEPLSTSLGDINYPLDKQEVDLQGSAIFALTFCWRHCCHCSDFAYTHRPIKAMY